MKAEHVIWWLALADQYEEWCDSPPTLPSGQERYTCTALENGSLGFAPYSAGALHGLWIHGFGDTAYPVGVRVGSDRAKRREAFCWWMAETIRDYVEEGVAPWESE